MMHDKALFHDKVPFSYDRASLQAGFSTALMEGGIHVPYLLLKTYKALDLDETEMLLLLHLMAFREREHKQFPTMDELQARMSIDGNTVARTLHRLLKSGYLAIDESMDSSTGIHYEAYNLQPLFAKLAEATAPQLLDAFADLDKASSDSTDLFTVFEREFGRPLSPMECETITGWIDQDRYGEDLIKAALKEAVFAGKLHFRYIDRILLEWERHRITSVEEAKQFTQKFRGS